MLTLGKGRPSVWQFSVSCMPDFCSVANDRKIHYVFGPEKKDQLRGSFFFFLPAFGQCCPQSVPAQQGLARFRILYYTLSIAHCLHSKAWPDMDGVSQGCPSVITCIVLHGQNENALKIKSKIFHSCVSSKQREK